VLHIRVENFQSIGHAALSAEGLTVIVGPSDRGKSALLRAIEAALFNRPGDQFVRNGQKQAGVTLEFPDITTVRTAQQFGHTVQWAKGSGLNKFTVNGEDYSRVGTKAPDALPALGFRDTLIGARLKDDGKLEGGEWMRPQVAHQFDRIFLLDKGGTFLNETLVGVSRLAVLQRAGRRCSLVLKGTKLELKTREADLQTAEAERAALAPVMELRARLQQLQTAAAALGREQARLTSLQALLAQRARVAPLAGQTVPVWRRRVLPEMGMTKLQDLTRLLAERATRAAGAAVKLPAMTKIKKPVLTMVQMWTALEPLVVEQRAQRRVFELCDARALRATDEQEQWQQALDQLKVDVRVCPTCDRPF
jgi:exonuclease SbcC